MCIVTPNALATTARTPLSPHIGFGEIISSGELTRRICAATGTGPVAARQLISRSKRDPGIWVLPIPLPGRGRLFALRDSVQDEAFYYEVADLLRERRPGIARTIRALLRHEVLLRPEAQKLLASPSLPTKSRTPTYDREIGFLVDLKFCRVDGQNTALERIVLARLAGTVESHTSARVRRARAIVETHLAAMLVDQLKKQGVVSWTGGAIPHSATASITFNNHVFSAHGFSFLDSMMRRATGMKPKPGSMLLDVLARPSDVEDVAGFIHRLSRVGGNPNARLQLLGVLAAYDFTREAWQLAKQKGLWTINLKQSLGDAALSALAQTETLLRIAGLPMAPDHGAAADEFAKLASGLDALKVHPYVSDLRALGFEAICAVLMSAGGWYEPQLGALFSADGVERDVDVLGKRNGGRDIYLVECKAEHEAKELEPEYVNKFFKETVPTALKAFPDTQSCLAELWTTGRVGERAREAFARLKVRETICAKIVDRDEILRRIPPTLAPCARLVSTISMPA